MHKFPRILLTVLGCLLNPSFTAHGSDKGSDTPALYQQHCASCHGVGRLGGIGPALLSQNLRRLKPDAAIRVITNGAAATQMPAFGESLSHRQIEALSEYIFRPLDQLPTWGLREIKATHIVNNVSQQRDRKPVFGADPLNLFVVVETGDHHVSIVDGDSFEPIHRFQSRRALHGGPKFSHDGRYVYFASRDGWVSKFDIYTLTTVAEIRAGINTRNLAVSGDSRYVAVGNYLPHSVVILDAVDLNPIKVIPVQDNDGQSSRVSAVYDAGPRNSFIAALKDLTEVWEISYADDPPYYGKVHDYRYEGPPKQVDQFPVRRIKLDDYLDDFFFDSSYDNLIGAARNAKNGQVVNLNVGRKINDLELAGFPHLGSGISWKYNDTTVLATPHLKESAVTFIDTKNWRTIRKVKTLGPGFFMRSHANSDYAWVDVFFGPDKDAVHIIDKRSLEITKTLRPEPGKTAAHVEFTRDGRYALLSIWDMQGAIVIYDAKTLQEVKRIPMVKPSGKYNVFNKIKKDEGTSH